MSVPDPKEYRALGYMIDGTPFDKPERRPHQLQIPLVRVG